MSTRFGRWFQSQAPPLLEQSEAFGTPAPGLREEPQLYSDPLANGGGQAVSSLSVLPIISCFYYILMLAGYLGLKSQLTLVLCVPYL